MRHIVLTLVCLFFPIFATASPPSQAEFDACASGESISGVQIKPIRFETLFQDKRILPSYSVTYAVQNKKKIGYAIKGEQQAIFYERHAYPIDKAEVINISSEDY